MPIAKYLVPVLLLAAVILSLASVAQTSASAEELRTFGDPLARAAIDTRVRSIYEAALGRDARRAFVFTRENPLAVDGAMGTEATGIVSGEAMRRIVATIWTPRGKYAVEFYQTREALLFVYETFVYFAESAPRDAWRNFMGLASWERRTWFGDGQAAVYAEARGTGSPAAGEDARRLLDQAGRLTRILQAGLEQAAAPVP